MKRLATRSTALHFVGGLLFVAVAYYVTGRLALLLAIPPGYATAVWPPAGIALAATLILGYRVWPGVMLGSFLVNIGTSFDPTSITTISLSISVAASIGLGAALQAIGGAYLIRRFIGYPTALDDEGSIVKFIGLGGVLGCLINATWGTGSLLLAGILDPSALAFNWWTWWVGDTIGVLIFVPITLILAGQPRHSWRPRRISVGLPLILLCTAAVLLFIYASSREMSRLTRDFDQQALNLSHALDSRLRTYEEDLHSLERFFTSSSQIGREDFRRFVTHTLEQHEGIQAIEWIPRVVPLERGAFELRAREDGFESFQITQQDPQGNLTRRTEADEYFPVFYLEPFAGNEAALGFDLASNPVRLAAMNRARDTGESVATERITLVQETGSKYGFLLFTPVYHRNAPTTTVDQRRENLAGFVLGVFKIYDIVATTLNEIEAGHILVQLVDVTDPNREQWLTSYGMDEDVHNPSWNPTLGIEWRSQFEIGRRTWQFLFSPPVTYLTGRSTGLAWSVLASVLLFTGLLGAFLLLVTGRTTRTERLVAERTRELSQTNQDLKREISERQLAENALQESRQSLAETNQMLQLVLDAIPVGVFWKNKDLVFLGCNQRVIDDAGKQSGDEIIGKSDYEMIWHEHADRYRADDLAVMESGQEMLDFEEPQVTSDGQKIWNRVSKIPFRDLQGSIMGVLGIYENITEQKLAAEALQKSEAQLKEAQRIAQVGSWEWDFLTGTLAWSDEMYRIHGVDLGDSPPDVETIIAQFTHPDDFQKGQDALRLALQETGHIDQEYRLRLVDQSIRYVHTQGQVEYDDTGSPVRMIGTTQDVTRTTKAREALRESEERLSEFINAVSYSIGIFDDQMRLLDLNQVGCDALGIEDKALMLGKPLKDLSPTISEDRVARYQLVLETRQPVTFLHTISQPDNPTSYISVSAFPVGSGFAVISEDVTEREEARIQLKEKADELERSNAELEQFAYVASHDLQEPLRTIAGFTQLIQRRYGDQLDEDAGKYMGFITTGTARMQALISDLLTFSRVGRTNLKKEELNANESVASVLRTLHSSIEDNKADITHSGLPTLWADKVQFGLLLQNLISNAIKFKSHLSPKVHVAAIQQGDLWYFSVQDNGIGIKETQREQIFEVFKRLHSQAHYQGTGIGLAICKKIVERHGGSIWVESTEGEGCTFYFTLPVAPASNAME